MMHAQVFDACTEFCGGVVLWHVCALLRRRAAGPVCYSGGPPSVFPSLSQSPPCGFCKHCILVMAFWCVQCNSVPGEQGLSLHKQIQVKTTVLTMSLTCLASARTFSRTITSPICPEFYKWASRNHLSMVYCLAVMVHTQIQSLQLLQPFLPLAPLLSEPAEIVLVCLHFA